MSSHASSATSALPIARGRSRSASGTGSSCIRTGRAGRGACRGAAGARMKIAGTLFLATLFCVTWEKVQWNVAGAVGLADVLTVMFLVAFALEWGRPRFPRTTVTVLAIFAALLVVYLIGYFNIETKQSLDQWGKGMVKFVLHFLFLGAGVAYLARRTTLFYWKAVAALTLGLVVNGVYGVLQLLAARAGTNLDQVLLSPLTGGAGSINVYGAIGGTTVY